MNKQIQIATILCLITCAASAGVAQRIAKDLDDAITAASSYADWKPEDSMYPKEDGKLALENGKTCIDRIDVAVSGGLNESTVVETPKGKLTITQAREMCVRVRDAGQKVFGDLTAAEEAQYEPFRQVLSADKNSMV